MSTAHLLPMLLGWPCRNVDSVPTAASGEIHYDKRWKQRGGSFMLKMFGQENIGRPAMDIESGEKEIRKFLSKTYVRGPNPSHQGYLVTMNTNAVIGDVADAPDLIVEAGALRRTIRKYDRKVEDGSSDPKCSIKLIKRLVVNKLSEETIPNQHISGALGFLLVSDI